MNRGSLFIARQRVNSFNLVSCTLSMLLTLLVSACGGGGGGSTPVTPVVTPVTAPAGSTNVVPVSVDGNIFGVMNSPFVSITLCEPNNGANCMTIDHILVDTGSVGLRVFAAPATTAALAKLKLTQQTVGGNPVVQCLPFVQGVTWGPVKLASLVVGSEIANNIALQVIADPGFTTIPTACSSQGAAMTSPGAISSGTSSSNTSFGANGVLGVGLYKQDCGPACAQSTQANVYFNCSTAGNNCVSITLPVLSQIQNPVSLFPKDNNGVILSLAALPNSGTSNDIGAITATGTLTFGVDTQNNNVSANSAIVTVDNNTIDPNYGYITTNFGGTVYQGSFIDSGSNGYFLSVLPPSGNLPLCSSSNFSGFYCPTTATPFTASITGSTGSTLSAPVNFYVGNISTLLNANPTYTAFDNVAGNIAAPTGTTLQSFDWGLPFFYGKNVYNVIETNTTTKGTGPYFGW